MKPGNQRFFIIIQFLLQFIFPVIDVVVRQTCGLMLHMICFGILFICKYSNVVLPSTSSISGLIAPSPATFPDMIFSLGFVALLVVALALLLVCCFARFAAVVTSFTSSVSPRSHWLIGSPLHYRMLFRIRSDGHFIKSRKEKTRRGQRNKEYLFLFSEGSLCATVSLVCECNKPNVCECVKYG